MPDDTQIFILHHTPAHKRKEILLKDIKALNIQFPIEWVEGFLPDELTLDPQTTLKEANIKGPTCIVTKKTLSVVLKHKFAVEQQIKNNIQNAIIFEDDVDLFSVPNLNLFLQKSIEELNNEKKDMLWIGGTKNYEVPQELIQKEKIAYFSENYASRLGHAYILSLRAAFIVYENLDILSQHLHIDHLYNEIIIFKRLITSGWTAPYITQKTDTGNWNSLHS